MLPEKYAVQVTEKSKKILGELRKSGSLSSTTNDGYCIWGPNETPGYYTRLLDGHFKEYEIISWELFQQEVLKITPKTPVYEIY